MLESLKYAKSRDANILAELVGYGASSDGDNIVKPNTDGAVRAIQQAINTTHKIDYINGPCH